MNQLSQLRKALELANDKGFVVGLSIPMQVTPIFASTSVLEAQIPTVVTTSKMFETTVLTTTPKIG